MAEVPSDRVGEDAFELVVAGARTAAELGFGVDDVGAQRAALPEPFVRVGGVQRMVRRHHRVRKGSDLQGFPSG